MILLAIAAHVIPFFFEPHLSNDHFRFIWDGEIYWSGINPFDYSPNELFHQPFVKSSEYLREIHSNISDLSQNNYTIYPTVNQWYFIVATYFGDSITVSTNIMRALMLGTTILGAMYLFKLIGLLSIHRTKGWLLYLNPLWIIECQGNLHFEGVMISFLIIALYFLVKNKKVIASLLFTIAVQIKLIPLIILPILWRRIGGKASLIVYMIIGLTTIGLSLVFLNGSNIGNFLASLRLYFGVFEFNSFILHYTISLCKVVSGWNMLREIGPVFSAFTFITVNYIAFRHSQPDWRSFFKRATFATLIYLLFTATIHPWYVLLLLFFSLLTEYSFGIIWSFLVFISYSFYTLENSADITYRSLVTLEYFVLGIVLYLEIKKNKQLFRLDLSS